MKPILRNFLSVIRRFKLAMVLNILGLSIAFAVFMIIMIQLDYDLGFDKFHNRQDRKNKGCGKGFNRQRRIGKGLGDNRCQY